MASTKIPALKAEIEALEAQYQQVEDRIDRAGGVDYQGELAALRRKLDTKRHELELWSKLWQAVESKSDRFTAKMIVELLLSDEDVESTQDVAADFIEDELGRFDWMNNWRVIREREDPVAKVQAYLDTYGIVADARQVVDYIDQMTVKNPGRWK